jgi:uncharacterized protein
VVAAAVPAVHDDAMSATSSDLVRVEYSKYDGRPHRGYPALRLGEDEHGVWLGVPGGDFVDAAPPNEFKYEDPYVLLVPRDEWWTAMFNSPPRRTEIYCDITTPATWAGDHLQLVDLDLDVRRLREDGDVQLLDEDEFEEHSLAFSYPADVVAAAWDAARFLQHALSDAIEPFAGAYHGWLDKVAP